MRPRAPTSAASSVLFLTLALAACAGNSGNGGAQVPAGPAAGDGGAAEPQTEAPAGPATTTSDLPDAGEGTKLTPATPAAGAAPDDAGAAPLHASEPGRSAKDIQTVVMTHRDEARACYDRSIDAHPAPAASAATRGMEGNLVVKWMIDPTGVVKDVAVDDGKSDIHDATVGACVVSVIQKLHFSASGKGLETRTHYPFNFHPHAAAKPAAK